jgi:hypothetical protein
MDKKDLAQGIKDKVVGKAKSEVSPTNEKSDGVSLLKTLNIFASNMMSLHLFARDTNVARQNTQKLVQLAGGKPTNKADAFFQTASERESKLESEREKYSTSPEPEPKEEEDGGDNLMQKILGIFGLGNLAKVFSLTKIVGLLRFIGPIFLITTIVSGIYKGWEAWKETGSLLEAFKAGITEFLDFITLGFFGKENIAAMFDKAVDFLTPIVDTIGNFFSQIGEFFSDKWEKFKVFFGMADASPDSDAYADANKSAKTIKDELNAEIIRLIARRDSLVEIRDKKKEDLEDVQAESEKEKKADYKGDDEVVRERQGLSKKSAREKAAQSRKATPAPAPVITPSASPKTEPAPTAGAGGSGPTPTPSGGGASAGGAGGAPGGGQPAKSTGSLKQVTTVQSGVDVEHFNPSFEEALTKMANAFKEQTGKPLVVTSGYRSNEKQKELWDAELAKQGGDVAKARKKVAPPAAPLGPGKGSQHLFGLAADIKPTSGAFGAGSPKGFLNELAGTRTADTGFLAKFGLIRPVAGEDWHLQPAKTEAVADGQKVVNNDGKVTDLGGGKPTTGDTVSKNSVELAQNQRAQEKRQTPTVVNAGTTNNKQVVKNTHQVQAA